MKLSRRAGVAVAILAVLMPTDAASPVWRLIAAVADLPDALSAHLRQSGSDRTARNKRRHIDPLQLALGGQTTGPFAARERVLAQVRSRQPEPGDSVPGDVLAYNAPGSAPGRLPGSFATFGAPAPATPGGSPPNNGIAPPSLPGGSSWSGGGGSPPGGGIIPPSPPGTPSPPGETSPTGPSSPPSAPVPPGSTTPAGPTPPFGPSPVPEPATWVSMILGLFGLGALLRKRRRSAAPQR